jgi:uncharacterized phage protein gp47/JayE
MPTLLTTLGPSINLFGASAPAYSDILYTLTQQFMGIYGSDIVTDPSTQDQQWLGILSRGFYDEGQAFVACYNAFRPTGAQGAGLSTIVKINGIARLIPSNSQVTALVVGQVGTIITNGVANDAAGNQWSLPSSVTIPISGQITVSLTCGTEGSIALASGVALTIFTPTVGWQTITTTSTAIPGAPVETDAALKIRQTLSVALPALTVMQSLVGNIANLTGVLAVQGYENDTGSTNALGIPAHSISMVVEGGSATAIAQIIANDKAPGAGTYGTTSETVINSQGIPQLISFYVASVVQAYAVTTINPLTGYVATTGTAILASQADYINQLILGQSLIRGKFEAVTNLYGDYATNATGQTQAALDLLSETYTLTSVYLARGDMTVTTTITTGAASLVIGNAGSLVVGNNILLTNSDGSQSMNSITSISGTTIGFSPAIATGKTVNSGSLVYVQGNLTAQYYEKLQTSTSNLTLIT